MNGTFNSGNTRSVSPVTMRFDGKLEANLKRKDARKARSPERQRRGTLLTSTPTFGTSVGALHAADFGGFIRTLLQSEAAERCGLSRKTPCCPQCTLCSYRLWTWRTLPLPRLFETPTVTICFRMAKLVAVAMPPLSSPSSCHARPPSLGALCAKRRVSSIIGSVNFKTFSVDFASAMTYDEEIL